jgi:hypothetical protein
LLKDEIIEFGRCVGRATQGNILESSESGSEMSQPNKIEDAEVPGKLGQREAM